MSRKLLVNDGSAERELLLVGTMAVGRDPRCDISDANPLLSRRHAEFEATPQGVRVRDLESRNGILVNGARVADSTLNAGDVVKIGPLTIKYVNDGPAAIGAVLKSHEHEDDATVLTAGSPSVAPRPAVRSELSASIAEENDKTRVMAPPVAEVWPAVAARPPGAEPGSRTLALGPPATAGAPRPAPAAAQVIEPAGSRQLKRVIEPRLRKGRMAKTSWGGRVLLAVLGLATAVFIVTAIPLQLFQGRVVESMAIARATALVNWLAADAARHLSAGDSLSTAADAVGHEPGVVTAVILTTDGQVLSPASRVAEKFELLPGIDEPPSNIFRLRSASHDGLIEIARPFGTTQRPRAGTAWVTFRSSVPADAGSVLGMLGPALFVALAGGLFVSNLINRMTTRALVSFNEDIDLAVTGQVAEVRDTLGAKPLQDLADTINYLIARVRGAADARAAAPRTTQAAFRPSGRGDMAMSGPSYVRPNAARIEADSKFRVTSASAECAELIGVRPDALVGLHLIDAIPDIQIVDAILKCTNLPEASHEVTVVVAPEGRSYQLELTVSQKSKDQPIAIGLRVLES